MGLQAETHREEATGILEGSGFQVNSIYAGMVWYILLLQLYTFQYVDAFVLGKDDRGTACTREVIIEAKEGELLVLENCRNSESLNFTVVFTNRKNEHQCCYGSAERCQFFITEGHLRSDTWMKGETHLTHLDTTQTSVCAVALESIGKAEEGFYEFFHHNDFPSTACHVFVEETQINFWKISFFCILALLFVAVIILYRLVVTANLTNFPETRKDEICEEMLKCNDGTQ